MQQGFQFDVEIKCLFFIVQRHVRQAFLRAFITYVEVWVLIAGLNKRMDKLT